MRINLVKMSYTPIKKLLLLHWFNFFHNFEIARLNFKRDVNKPNSSKIFFYQRSRGLRNDIAERIVTNSRCSIEEL